MGASLRLLLAGPLVACACSSESPARPVAARADVPAAVDVDDEADRAAALAAFEAYRAALLAKDGERTRALVDQKTIDTYEKLLGQARTVDRAGLAELDWMGKMTVLLARHELDGATLAGMTGESMIVTAVERGWIDPEGVRDIEVARVEVSGEHARVSLAPMPGLPRFHLVEEADGWKLALWKSLPQLEPVMQKMFAESGEEAPLEWLIKLIETMSPKKFDRARLDGPAP